MKVITLLNEKGGVGKTTLATHIAVGLALRGRKVLVVDADPQANTTVAFGVPKQPRFHDLIVRNDTWKDSIVMPSWERFDAHKPDGLLMLLPGDIESRVVPIQISDHRIVRLRFRELESKFDYIIVDTSPTPSLLHSSIMLASDYIFAPTDCERFAALDGLVETIAHVSEIHEQAALQGVSLAKFAGIIPNKYRAGTMAHSEVYKYLEEKYPGLVLAPIPLTTNIVQAQLENQFLYKYAPDAKITSLMWDLVDSIEVL